MGKQGEALRYDPYLRSHCPLAFSEARSLGSLCYLLVPQFLPPQMGRWSGTYLRSLL